MSPRQLVDMAASVKQRPLNLSRERGEVFNFLLKRCAAERLLYRLDRSGHASDFILKGAMLFHLAADRLPHRATRDLDLWGRGASGVERVEGIFRQICGVRVAQDGLAFLENSVDEGLLRSAPSRINLDAGWRDSR